MEKELAQYVSRVLPGKADKVPVLIDVFKAKGLTDLKDVHFLEPACLEPTLTHVEANKLLTFLKLQKPLDAELFHPPPANPIPPRQRAGPSRDITSAPYFSVPWHKLPTSIKAELDEGKNLTNRDLNKVVDIVVSDFRATVPGAERKCMNAIANDMLCKYPNLEKVIEREIKPCLLSSKLKIKYDNLNRQPVKTSLQIQAPAITAAHGCLNWQILEIPEGETEETLKEKKSQMQAIHKDQPRKDWDWKEIEQLMEKTYGLQRRDINSQFLSSSKKTKENQQVPKTTNDLEVEWPFLFEYRGVVIHFQILTGVDIVSQISSFLNDRDFERLLDFLGEHKRAKLIKSAMDRSVARETCQESELIGMFLMLAENLKETREEIIRTVESTVERDDITNMELPLTPCIIAAGQSVFRAKKFFVAFDGKARLATKRFGLAFTAFFCFYFIFNISYPKKAASTMDFLQRKVAKINPPSGSKVPSTSRRGQVKSNFSRLINEFEAFLQRERDDESDPDAPNTPERSG